AYHGSDNNVFYIKNFRLAEGGVKYYDRFLQDGKIVANGIRFDVNKATLRPESMGVINEIAALMKDHPEVNFSVEGHTDSDGEDASNQTLSEQRAATVVSTLVTMDIDSNRLTSKGWGESKPMDTNDTPEGKANNRRVEFVKK
ncbi:MAG TPA: OmpA family protein, partial [Tangfeifania sp.]|nr:OmpA family protein [Tangfeifania sp.]